MSINYAPASLKGRSLKTKSLGSTAGFIVHEKHLVARRANARGKFLQFIPGHGGDVIAVTHKWGVGVYLLTEVQFDKPVKLKSGRYPRKLKKRMAWSWKNHGEKTILFPKWRDAFRFWREKTQRSQPERYILNRPLLRPIINGFDPLVWFHSFTIERPIPDSPFYEKGGWLAIYGGPQAFADSMERATKIARREAAKVGPGFIVRWNGHLNNDPRNTRIDYKIIYQ